MKASRPLAVLCLLLPLLAAPVLAKQVRVNVSNYAFSPATVSAGVGDHVVWIWTGGFHTVTSGDWSAVSDLQAGDGLFNSSPDGGTPPNATFSWKVTTTGTRPYYCQPHIPDMAGSLDLVASGATGLADFRITEVEYGAAGNLDRIEITNAGDTGNLGMYRLSVAGGAAQDLKSSGSGAAATDLVVPPGGHLVVHVNAAGTNSSTDVYLPGITDLPATGSVALYVPNTFDASLASADQLVDYVQWGAGGQGNEATAVAAGLWSAGTFAPAVASGSSIEFCGQPGQYGATSWYVNPTPNFGASDNCIVPTHASTWGRIKSLYR